MPFRRLEIIKLRIFALVIYAGLIVVGVWLLLLGDITSLIVTAVLIAFFVSDLLRWTLARRKPELEKC